MREQWCTKHTLRISLIFEVLNANFYRLTFYCFLYLKTNDIYDLLS